RKLFTDYDYLPPKVTKNQFICTFTCTLALMLYISLFIGNTAVVAANIIKVQAICLHSIQTRIFR
ncbi:hypothetical protein, partial [Bacteroides cellulosilyticus]|uniref:hypothetical protein n=1 Tax=Bacteroides cellulosilyticus TaxID=246787 RepID=UPI0022E8BAD1